MSCINNKFLECMKLCLVHKINYENMNLSQVEFNKLFINLM